MKSFDLVNSQVTLYSKGNMQTHYSKLGCIVSYIILFLVIGLSAYFTKQLIIRQNPISNLVNQFVNDAGELSMNQNQLFHIIGFTKTGNQRISLTTGKSVFKITGKLIQQGTGVLATYDYDNCIYDLDAYGLEDLFTNKTEFELGMCVRTQTNLTTNQTTVKTKTVQDDFKYPTLAHGQQSSIQSILYEIRITPCINGTGVICKDKEYINSVSTQAVKIYYVDNFFDISNYTNPRIPYLNSNNNPLNPAVTYNTALNFQKTLIDTDDGILFETSNKEEYWFLDVVQKDAVISSNGTLVFFGFYLKNMYRYYKRTYVKSQQILANIGGVVKALTVLGKVIVSLFDKYQIYMMIQGFLKKNGIYREAENRGSSSIQVLKNNITPMINSYFVQSKTHNPIIEQEIRDSRQSDPVKKNDDGKRIHSWNFFSFIKNYYFKRGSPSNANIKMIFALRNHFLEEENLFGLHIKVKKLMKHLNIDESQIKISTHDFINE